jgi:hypothetical protein
MHSKLLSRLDLSGMNFSASTDSAVAATAPLFLSMRLKNWFHRDIAACRTYGAWVLVPAPA